jgi:hypothetical protein
MIILVFAAFKVEFFYLKISKCNYIMGFEGLTYCEVPMNFKNNCYQGPNKIVKKLLQRKASCCP